MRYFLMMCMLLAGAGAASGQSVVSGTVVDAQSAPIPFATVWELGTRNTIRAEARQLSIALRGRGAGLCP